MRKIYRLSNMDACKLQTTYCGVKVALEFRDTMIKSKKEATLSTNNPFIQDAIEHDSRYGKVFTLMAAYDDTPKVAEVVEEEVRLSRKKGDGKKRRTQEEMDKTNEMNVNDAIAFFESKGEQVSGDEQLTELAEKYGVVIK